MQNIAEIISAINESQSCDDIKRIVEEVDQLWRAGQITLTEKDWPEISSCVAKNKGRIDAAADKNNKELLFSIMRMCNNFYQHQLRNHPNKMEAVNYLSGRGLDGKTAKEFQIGYAPPGWTNLRDSFANEDDRLTRCGMLAFKDGSDRGYDRFRNRIMFPIHDMRGNVIAFGSRVLDDSKPKYINSPETPTFSKSSTLYGLDTAREAIQKQGRCDTVLPSSACTRTK